MKLKGDRTKPAVVVQHAFVDHRGLSIVDDWDMISMIDGSLTISKFPLIFYFILIILIILLYCIVLYFILFFSKVTRV